jgi:hypothetical protein
MNEKLPSPKSCHAMVDGSTYILGQGDQRMTALDYEAYPDHDKSLPADVFDRAVYRQRLTDDAGRLFSSSEINIDVAIRNAKSRSVTWKSQKGQGSEVRSNVSKSRIDSESSLESTLEVRTTDSG